MPERGIFLFNLFFLIYIKNLKECEKKKRMNAFKSFCARANIKKRRPYFIIQPASNLLIYPEIISLWKYYL